MCLIPKNVSYSSCTQVLGALGLFLNVYSVPAVCADEVFELKVHIMETNSNLIAMRELKHSQAGANIGCTYDAPSAAPIQSYTLTVGYCARSHDWSRASVLNTKEQLSRLNAFSM